MAYPHAKLSYFVTMCKEKDPDAIYGCLGYIHPVDIAETFSSLVIDTAFHDDRWEKHISAENIHTLAIELSVLKGFRYISSINDFHTNGDHGIIMKLASNTGRVYESIFLPSVIQTYMTKNIHKPKWKLEDLRYHLSVKLRKLS